MQSQTDLRGLTLGHTPTWDGPGEGNEIDKGPQIELRCQPRQCPNRRLYLKSPPIPSNSALFEGTAIFSGVRNHSGRSQVHSFNPTMHRKNECTTDVHSTARESP